MFVKQTENLLPKRLTDGVAPKTSTFQHQLSRLGVLRKLLKFHSFSKLSKASLGGVILLYLSGYQPILAIPPFKQSLVKAATIQEQLIDAGKLPHPFILPHPGYISTHFSSWHPGVDIATGLGMPIHPIAPGKVVETTFGWFGLGHLVIVEHEQGFKSTYGHMGKIYVKKDDSVGENSILGEVGMTGHTSGPHTHLEVTKNGQYINPDTILPPLPDWPQAAGKAPQGQNEKIITPAPTAKPVKLPEFVLPAPVKSNRLTPLLP